MKREPLDHLRDAGANAELDHKIAHLEKVEARRFRCGVFDSDVDHGTQIRP